ncbi:4Fe-4S binding protein [Thermodesulfobacteriota bacterium B35]
MHRHKEQQGRAGRGAARYGRWRLLTLLLAFLVILVNPLLNYHLGINWLQGWYQSLGVGHLWFVSPLEGLESLLVTRSIAMASFIGMLIPLLLAFLLGRVFCSWICPISFFAELLDHGHRLVYRNKRRQDLLVPARRLLWFVLVGELLLSMILGAPVFVVLSPPGLVGREIMMAVFFHRLPLEGLILLPVLGMELVCRRLFCRCLCPLGGLLALVGSRRRLVVAMEPERCVQCFRCDRNCPLGLRPSRGETLTSYCWNCGACIDACGPAALAFRWQHNGNPSRDNQPPVFSTTML